MIVRLLGEGQFRVDDALFARLNELDDEIARAKLHSLGVELDGPTEAQLAFAEQWSA